METKEINSYKEAAIVWKETIKLARKEAKDGVKLLDFANKLEQHILDSDCGIGFPINLSLNEKAAHFVPTYNDTELLKESDLLKIDIGVHKDGFICDGAISINLDNTHAKQIEANELALENAISVAKFGVSVDKIGAEIENTLKSKGFNPVYNLGGHGLGKYEIHSTPSIPNHANSSSVTLKEGAIAVEPFASTGDGYVSESSIVEIFALNKGKNVRNMYGRKILETAKQFNDLPFAERWLRREVKLNDFCFTVGLKELMKANTFQTFPGLKENQGKFVTQVEKSLLILEDKTIVLGE
ncbi:MAG: type II methionyl aminopeptidase [archaeon]|jgi:methionyl aminopeptidase